MEELPEEMLQRFEMLEKSLAVEQGRFLLFGLFLRENAPNRWDVIASAPWIEAAPADARKLFLRRLQEKLPMDDRILLTQIAFIPPHGADYDAAMRRIARAVRAASGSSEVEHGLVEMDDVDLFGQTIAHAYILTARPLDAPVVV